MTWQQLFADWLVYSAMSGLIVLMLGGAVSRLVRQPVYRIRVIQWTLAGCLLIPLLQTAGWLSRHTLAILPNGLSSAATLPVVSREPNSGQVVPSADGRPLAESDAEMDRALRDSGSSDLALGPMNSVTAPQRGIDIETATGSATPVPAVLPGITAGWRLAAVVQLAFCFGAGLLALRLVVGVLTCRTLLRTARPASSAIVERFRCIAGPADKQTRVLISDRIDSPITWGLLHPVILLPASMAAEPNSAELLYCLAHEWSHVRRRDICSLWLASLVQLACYYQPMYWWLRRQLLLDHDYLADADAADHGHTAADYAEFLVSLARRRYQPTVPIALAMGDRPSRLTRRVLELVRPDRPLQRQSHWLPTAGIATGALALCLTLATVHLAALPTQARESSMNDLNAASDDPAPATSQQEKKAQTAGKVAAKAVGNQGEKPASDKHESAITAQRQPEPITYRGKVLDRISHQPIAGVTVEVTRQLSRDPKTGEWVTLETTSHDTNAAGEYEFTLPPEQVAEDSLYLVVDAHHPNYQPKGRSGYSHSMILTNLANGEPPFYSQIDLSPGQPAFGVVKTADGKPVSGMNILAYTKAPSQDDRLSFELGAFQRATTDGEGRFRLVVATPGAGVFWLFPAQASPQAHVIPDERGDLGTFTLEPGIELSGRVLNAQGEPVRHVWVNARRRGDGEKVDEFLKRNAVANQIGRAAMTDDSGHFQMASLPAGEYRIEVSGEGRDPATSQESSRKVELVDVFLPYRATLQSAIPPAPLEIRAVPHVVVRARVFRSNGEPRASHEQTIFGKVNGEFMFCRSNAPKQDGWFEFKVPHGLEEARVRLTTNEHSALRWRKSHEEPLEYGHEINLGTLESDRLGIEVIRYDAPMLLIKAVDESGVAVNDFQPEITYEQQPAEQLGGRFVYGGDVNCEHQPDGRWRSSQLLPDQKFSVVANKDGFVSDAQSLSLPEGGHQEITFVLRKKE